MNMAAARGAAVLRRLGSADGGALGVRLLARRGLGNSTSSLRYARQPACRVAAAIDRQRSYGTACWRRSGAGARTWGQQGQFPVYFVRRGMSSLPSHHVVGLPALSPTMESGTISAWKVKEGEAFAPGDILCQVETDKATVDFESQEEGYIARILVPAGTPDIAVGRPIMVTVDDESAVAAFKDFVAPGGAAATGAEAAPAAPAPAAPQAAPAAAAAPAPAAPAAAPAPAGGRVFASPLARKLAKDAGYEISAIKGTGPNSRVIAADVREYVPSAADKVAAAAPAPKKAAAAAAPAGAPAPPAGPFRDFELTEAAKAYAAKMTVSKQTVPHYYLTVDMNLEALLGVRAALNAQLAEDAQLSVNDLLLKAAALACRTVPDVNSSWMDSFVRQFHAVDINVFVNTDAGLVTPLVKDVGTRGLKAISDDVRALAAGAKESTLSAEQVATGTLSVVNLGAYGVKSAAPIVTPPQACTLALGVTEERVVPDDDPESEQVYKVARCLTATLSCDHRVVDGAVGAAWLAAYKKLVENPLTMLL